MPRLLVLFIACLSLSTAASAQTRPSEAEIDRLVTSAMEAFEVPGIALGIVKDGQLIFAKGYGARDISSGQPVDADTLFGIASNTKGITATALGMLVDEKKLDWDDKVTKYIPEFEFYAPYVTQEFTIRDLLTHRSGLPLGAGDLLWFPTGDFTPSEVLAGLKHLKPVTSFRSRYAYNNMLYVVAGEVVARVSGQSWGDFVQQRIFEPLGMATCKTLRAHAGGNANIAMPHAKVEGEMQALAIGGDYYKTAEAAAGVVCNITDLAKWLAMHLNEGKRPDGDVLISERQQRELWTAQTVQSVSQRAFDDTRTQFRAYGLGYALQDFYGFKRVSHGGGLPGMLTHISMIPELELGVIVLTNQQAGGAMHAITNHILSAYTEGKQKDWVAILKARADQETAEMEKREQEIWATAAKAGAAPLALADYVGTYRDPWRGDVTIEQHGKQLLLKFSRSQHLEGALHHYKNGVFIVRWHDRSLFADAFVLFSQNFRGEVDGMKMEALLPNTDFSFDFHHLDFTKVRKRE